MNHTTNRTLRSRERGTTLVATLIMTGVLAVIVTASLNRSLYTWNEMGRSYHRESALHVAESGAEMALYALNHQVGVQSHLIVGLDDLLPGLTQPGALENLSGTLMNFSGDPVGDYDVNISVDPTNPARVLIVSTSTVPTESQRSDSRVSRTVRVVVERSTFDGELFGAAIYTPTWIDTNGITEIHGNTISGNLLRSTPNSDPHDRVEQYEYEYFDETTGTVQTAYGTVDEGRNMDGDPDNDIVLPFDEFTLEQFKQIAVSQGYYFENEPKVNELPTGFYQPDGVTPNVIFITDSIHFAGNWEIGGLIFVVGDVYDQPEDAAFGGSDIINGIVYTTGQFRTHGGGNRTINVDGGVFCGAANMQGHTVVEYNWEYFDALKNLANASNKFRFASWQEIIDTNG